MSVAPVPPHPKIYHIAQVDRLPSVAADGVYGAMRKLRAARQRARPSV